MVAGERLVWSKQKGELGTGPLLSVDDLPVGQNRITLTATNSAGLSASASITVIVGDDLNLPGPFLSIGPSQVSWAVANGDTQPRTAVVELVNSGDDSALSWTAASSAAWLTVNAAGGVTPAALTLTANPAGFASDTLHQATITLTATGNGAPQVVTIPVMLTIGGPGAGAPSIPPPGGPSRRPVYLPFAQKR